MDIAIMGNGPVTVLALHGIQGTNASWLPVAQALADKARFILPNLRGRGAAMRGVGEQDYALPLLAAEALQALQIHAPVGDYVLAGWSMGVSVALQMLAVAPARRPRGLVLLSGTPCIAQVRWFRAQGPALHDEIRARERRLGLQAAADVQAVAHTWGALRRSDQRALLALADMPTLLIHGSADEDCPLAHARDMAQRIAGARLLALEGVGHGVLSEARAQVAAAIGDFISLYV